MSMLRPTVWLFAAVMVLVGGACSGDRGSREAGSADDAAGRPNIVLIVVDTLRADRLGAYGYPRETSPNINALAERGVLFERCTTVAPTTLASVTSILTGKHPHTHGAYRNGIRWPDALEGVPSALRDAGYVTAAFIGSYALAPEFGTARGFDHFDARLTQSQPDLLSNKLTRSATEVSDAALGWLRSRAAEEGPFFALVHYFDPHWPYQPPAEFLGMFDPGYRGPTDGSMAQIAAARGELRSRGGVADVDTRRLHTLYLEEVRYCDAEIGRLLDGLESSAHAGQTLIVLTADHGETFWEHDDYLNHGLAVYDSTLHIPLILAGVGIRSPRTRVTVPVSTVDLAPTLLSYAGVELPEGLEGRSLRSLLEDPRSSPGVRARDRFAEATQPSRVEGTHPWPNRLKARCVMRDQYKLIRTPWRGGRWELYDLEADPSEAHDLFASPPFSMAEREDLMQALTRWSDDVAALGTPIQRELDERTRELLQTLGYVE